MRKFTQISYLAIVVSFAIMVTCFYLLYKMPAKQVQDNSMLDTSRDIVVYTKAGCPYCVWAKELLAEKMVGYKEVDMSGDEKQHYEMYLKTGQKTVPYIYIEGKLIGGYDDLVEISAKW